MRRGALGGRSDLPSGKLGAPRTRRAAFSGTVAVQSIYQLTGADLEENSIGFSFSANPGIGLGFSCEAERPNTPKRQQACKRFPTKHSANTIRMDYFPYQRVPAQQAPQQTPSVWIVFRTNGVRASANTPANTLRTPYEHPTNTLRTPYEHPPHGLLSTQTVVGCLGVCYFFE